MNQIKRTINVDLGKILLTCLKRWWFIAAAMVLAAGISVGATRLLITPTYQSTVQIYVNNFELSENTDTISTADLNAASKLVDLYKVFLNTDDTLNVILDATELNYNYGQLRKMMSTSSVDGTQVFRVTVTSESPTEAQLLASTIGEVLPEVITQTVKGADAKVISHALLPTQPNAPNYTKNAIIGAVIGFMAAFLYLAFSVIRDTRIHSIEDIQALSSTPILVCIPDFNGKQSKKYAYGYGTYQSQDKARRLK